MASHKFFLCRVPSTLSQQTFVLGVSFELLEKENMDPYDLVTQPAAQLWPNAARIPFKKADLAVRLVFHYLLNCGREVCRFLRGRSCLLAALHRGDSRALLQSSPKLRGKPL